MENKQKPSAPIKCKRGERNPEKWKRNIAKKERYSAKGLPELPTCGHNVEHLKCDKLRLPDLLKFHEAFYKNVQKAEQDHFILEYCSPKDTKRRRPLNNTRNRKIYHTNFTIPQGKTIVPVCQQTFIKTLGITKHRVGYLMKNVFESGEIPNERRGGNRTSAKYLIRIESILNFIREFESFLYEASEDVASPYKNNLNVNKLCRKYNMENPTVPVTEHYFRSVFNKICNLGFEPTDESSSEYSE